MKEVAEQAEKTLMSPFLEAATVDSASCCPTTESLCSVLYDTTKCSANGLCFNSQ